MGTRDPADAARAKEMHLTRIERRVRLLVWMAGAALVLALANLWLTASVGVRLPR